MYYYFFENILSINFTLLHEYFKFFDVLTFLYNPKS